MLQKLGDHIAECRRRASECEDLAKDGLDQAVADQYRAMAKHWTRLADSYEFNVTLERFLHDMHEAGRPFHVEDIPKPPSYDDWPDRA
jgi:hypothetical protein